MLALVLWSCVPLLYCFALGALALNMPLFRVLRAFLARFMGFVWVCLVWCFAWLVGLLCACEVRRIYGLLRVCLSFSSLVLLSCFRPALLLGFLPCLLSCSLSCFLGFVAWLLVLVGLLAFFPFRTASDTKKGRIFCVPSCGVLLVGC